MDSKDYEFRRAVREFGRWTKLYEAMVTEEAIALVREFNELTDSIMELHLEDQDIDLGEPYVKPPRWHELQELMGERYQERDKITRKIHVLVRGEDAVNREGYYLDEIYD